MVLGPFQLPRVIEVFQNLTEIGSRNSSVTGVFFNYSLLGGFDLISCVSVKDLR